MKFVMYLLMGATILVAGASLASGVVVTVATLALSPVGWALGGILLLGFLLGTGKSDGRDGPEGSDRPTGRPAIEAQIEYTDRRRKEASVSLGRNYLYHPSELPAEYDDCVFDGVKYVDGNACRTVGELKAANAKFYGEL